ncbi:protein kinase family protein [Cellulomonas telluris]|uniref:protein kinase family protein n=1 Tax=Cellulomonas telluris TaxID=2306636 RepID=UPI0010A7D9D7|nr:protein kinase family protein [Cellulomonas telluris]
MAEVGRGTVLAGRYRVLEPLPSDLEGVSVWRAVDQILDRPVRVRVLQSGDVAPALDAARRAALVTDARLVRVLDVGMHEGVGYVVTEQIVGASLAQLVENGPLTADQARAVVGEAAAALEVARRRGVHHLALRPSVVHVSADGRVLLSGLALDAALTGLPPGDAAATSRTDAVDLVRLLYTALTGRWPADQQRGVGPSPDVETAPVLDGAPVPPAELTRGVPNDLDTLCTVTLGSYGDGPHTPGELVHELEPWGEIRVGRAADGPVDAATAGAAAAAPAAADVETETAPVRVPRQSVRTVFDEAPPGVVRPGTPPPAAPARASGLPGAGPRIERTSALPAAGAGAAAGAAAAAAAPPTLPATIPPVAAGHGGPPPSVAPAGPAEDEPWGGAWDDGGDDPFPFEQDEPEERRRFGATGLVLVLVGLAVLVGLVLAARALFTSPDLTGGGTEPEQTASSAPSEPTDDGSEPPASPEQPAAGPPVVIGIRSLDASDADGEHEEAVTRATDGDPGTYWFSQTYNRPDFAGLKEGVGLELRLAQATAVSGVTLQVNGSGGNVEVRATSGDAPTQGDVLASGPMGPETALTFAEPVETDVITIWFTELPTMPDGRFRIELPELGVS